MNTTDLPKDFNELRIKVLDDFLKDPQLTNLNQLLQLGELNVPDWHFSMLQDVARLNFYNHYLESNARDKVVLDLGSGSGILAYLALRAGAKKVYAVEHNPVMSCLLRHNLESQIHTDQLILLQKDARALIPTDFSDLPDIVVHEIFGADGVSEQVLDVCSQLSSQPSLGQAEFFPNNLQVFIQPIKIFHPFFGKEINDYQEFSFAKVQILAALFPSYLSNLFSYNTDWVETGETIKLLETNINQLHVAQKLQVRIKSGTQPTHLRFWFTVKDQSSHHSFSNDLQLAANHWLNKVSPIPTLVNPLDFELDLLLSPKSLKIWQFNS